VPSPLVDGVDLRRLSPHELKERADAHDGYVIDYSMTIPAQYQMRRSWRILADRPKLDWGATEASVDVT
jgi:hypothetical protein